jgi:hypothetical protein
MRSSRTAVAFVAVAWSAAAAAEKPAVSLLEQPAPFGAALRSRFGQDARVLGIGIGSEDADVEVQDPTTPSHVDRYAFEEGALGEPEPVQVGRNQRELNARLFPLADVDLSIVPRLLPDARERARTEEGQATQVTIERVEGSGDYPGWGKPLIHVIVNGPRGGAVVKYGLDGKHRGTTRW